SERRRPWHSASLGERALPFDLEKFRRMEFFVPEYDYTELQPVLPLTGLYAASVGLAGAVDGFGPVLTGSALVRDRREPAVSVRRVLLKTPYTWITRGKPVGRDQDRQPSGQRGPERWQQPGGPESGRRPPPPPPGDYPAPALYAQCAAETTQRDLRKAAL